jgi:D-alanyl-D-alanine dipeptidase
MREILPSEWVNAKQVRDNGEPLKPYGGALLRSGAIERLKLAQENLPSGMQIIVLSGFRSIDEQAELWNGKMNELRSGNPEASEAELRRMARKCVADPENGGGGHQTGGAADVTLADARGRELDLGGRYLEFDEAAPTRAVKNENREILLDAMTSVGFANYPREWWHFSYGDKMWAAYGRRRHAIYGACRRFES